MINFVYSLWFLAVKNHKEITFESKNNIRLALESILLVGVTLKLNRGHESRLTKGPDVAT